MKTIYVLISEVENNGGDAMIACNSLLQAYDMLFSFYRDAVENGLQIIKFVEDRYLDYIVEEGWKIHIHIDSCKLY